MVNIPNILLRTQVTAAIIIISTAKNTAYEPVRKLQNERAEIENALISIEEEKKRFLARKSAFIRDYTILLNLYPRIQHTYKLICAKEEKGELPPAIDKNQVKRLLEHVDEPCPLCNGTIGEN